jgi:hypothetical protein
MSMDEQPPTTLFCASLAFAGEPRAVAKRVAALRARAGKGVVGGLLGVGIRACRHYCQSCDEAG